MSERLFFALWPSATDRAQLAAAIASLPVPDSARMQRADQWHATLVFLGRVADVRIPAVLECASAVRAAAVTVAFDALEHWRRPQVLCLTASSTPAPLQMLVDQLRDILSLARFSLEQREYRPHVTIARKVRAPVGRTTLAEPLVWSARRFALVRSISDSAGSRYEPMNWWNLSAGKS